MFRPTIYKKPHVYRSNEYKSYSVSNGAGVYKLPGLPQELYELITDTEDDLVDENSDILAALDF